MSRGNHGKFDAQCFHFSLLGAFEKQTCTEMKMLSTTFEHLFYTLGAREWTAQSCSRLSLKPFSAPSPMRFEMCLVIANCTVQLMTDPVTTCDGHTFERSAIERWLTGVTSILPLTLCISIHKLPCIFARLAGLEDF